MGTREPQASTQTGSSFSNLSSRLLDLDITSTIKAFQDGKKAYASKKYPDAIDYYTQALNHLKTDLESVILLHRAAAYKQQQEHEIVTKDTELAHRNNNTDGSDDHIVHANALSLDKKHKEALQTYEAGLTASKNNSSDNQHINKPLNEKRQELFQVLSNEIISTIVSNLSIKDRIQLSITSRSWNTFIQQWRSTCYNVNLHQDLSIDLTIDKKILNAIPEDGPKNIILGMSDRDIARNGIPAYFLNIIDASKLNKINSLGSNNQVSNEMN
ncbi:hypothetical protein BDC45DRAFT_495467 [Circinella umbellata]|nr:hypothetical protein BDC45DRAFT_495467 [Circinella umbellata]